MSPDKSSVIVVTGGRGFLGQAVVERLASSGYRNVHTFGSRDFDLTKEADAEKMFFYYRPEVVLHLAARVGGIGANIRNPGKFCYDNLTMGVHVIEKSRKYNVKKLVITGTVCGYPKFAVVPFEEEGFWNGYPEETNAPYGIAKKMLLVLAQSYRRQYDSNFVFLLPGNLFGPRDHFDLENSHVIPAMIRKIHAAKVENSPSVSLWGDGSPTREFVYVDDCAEALVLALERYDGADPINIGSGQEISMRNLAHNVSLVVGYAGSITWDASRPNGQPRRCLDTSRAKALLGWTAKTSLEDGLKETFAWYLANKTMT